MTKYILAAYAVLFNVDETGLINFAKGYLNPILNVCLALVPLITAIMVFRNYMNWNKTPHHPGDPNGDFFTGVLKDPLIAGIVIESVVALMKFFGLSV